MPDFAAFNEWFTPSAIFLSTLLLAFVFDHFVLRWLKNLAIKSEPEGEHLLITTLLRRSSRALANSLKGLTACLIIIIGTYFAFLNAPVSILVLHYSKKILIVAGVIVFTIVISRITVGLVKMSTRKVSENLPATSILRTITRIVVFSIGTLVILQTLGVSITPILTALGVGGIAVALALQDTLANLFAGFHVIMSNNIRPGDFIRLDTGEEGTIADINWRNTIIKTPQNNITIVPNSKVASAKVTNFNFPDNVLAFSIPVLVGFSCDLAHAEKVSVEAAREILQKYEGGVKDYTPVARYHSFSESGIMLNVVLKALSFDAQFVLRHEFIKLLHARFRKEGIEIPYPTRTISVIGHKGIGE